MHYIKTPADVSLRTLEGLMVPDIVGGHQRLPTVIPKTRTAGPVDSR